MTSIIVSPTHDLNGNYTFEGQIGDPPDNFKVIVIPPDQGPIGIACDPAGHFIWHHHFPTPGPIIHFEVLNEADELVAETEVFI